MDPIQALMADLELQMSPPPGEAVEPLPSLPDAGLPPAMLLEDLLGMPQTSNEPMTSTPMSTTAPPATYNIREVEEKVPPSSSATTEDILGTEKIHTLLARVDEPLTFSSPDVGQQKSAGTQLTEEVFKTVELEEKSEMEGKIPFGHNLPSGPVQVIVGKGRCEFQDTEVKNITRFDTPPDIEGVGRHFAINHDHMCYGVRAGMIRAIDVVTAARDLLHGHSQPLTDMKFFSETSALLCSLALDSTAFVWQVRSNQHGLESRVVLQVVHSDPRHHFTTFQWHPSSDSMLAVLCSGGSLEIWDLKERRAAGKVGDDQWPIANGREGVKEVVKVGDGAAMRDLAWSADGTMIMAAGGDVASVVRVWDAATLELKHEFHPHGKLPVSTIHWVRGSALQQRLFLSTSSTQQVQLWDTSTWTCLQNVGIRSSDEMELQVVPGGDGSLGIVEEDKGAVVVLDPSGHFLTLLFSPHLQRSCALVFHLDEPVEMEGQLRGRFDFVSCYGAARVLSCITQNKSLRMLSKMGKRRRRGMDPKPMPPASAALALYCVQHEWIQQYELPMDRLVGFTEASGMPRVVEEKVEEKVEEQHSIQHVEEEVEKEEEPKKEEKPVVAKPKVPMLNLMGVGTGKGSGPVMPPSVMPPSPLSEQTDSRSITEESEPPPLQISDSSLSEMLLRSLLVEQFQQFKKDQEALMAALQEKLTKHVDVSVNNACKRVIVPAVRKAVEKTIMSHRFVEEVSGRVIKALPPMMATAATSALRPALTDAFTKTLIPNVEKAVNVMLKQADHASRRGIGDARAALTSEVVSVTQQLTAQQQHSTEKLVESLRSMLQEELSELSFTQEEDGMKEITQYLAKKEYQKAFVCALEAMDMSLLMYLLGEVSVDEVEESGPLSQEVLLSLLQQLSYQLEENTEVKLAWLMTVALGLDVRDKSIAESVRKVLKDAHSEIKTALGQSDAKFAQNLQILLHIVTSLTARLAGK